MLDFSRAAESVTFLGGFAATTYLECVRQRQDAERKEEEARIALETAAREHPELLGKGFVEELEKSIPPISDFENIGPDYERAKAYGLWVYGLIFTAAKTGGEKTVPQEWFEAFTDKATTILKQEEEDRLGPYLQAEFYQEAFGLIPGICSERVSSRMFDKVVESALKGSDDYDCRRTSSCALAYENVAAILESCAHIHVSSEQEQKMTDDLTAYGKVYGIGRVKRAFAKLEAKPKGSNFSL
ncbi:MAG: hypothetical protein PHW76_08530 [Alphaproteobacteria bacterium]|nr:hypothetical protein [Alphaproteobacteria bacterium]